MAEGKDKGEDREGEGRERRQKVEERRVNGGEKRRYVGGVKEGSRRERWERGRRKGIREQGGGGKFKLTSSSLKVIQWFLFPCGRLLLSPQNPSNHA